MFQQTFVGSEKRRVNVWALAASFCLQGCLLGLSILLPLVATYDLPVGDWVRRSLLLTPPPPPAPRAAPSVSAPPVHARFDGALIAPQIIPRNAVIAEDGVDPAVSAFAAPDIATAGGIDGDGAGNVLGVIGAVPSKIRVPDKPVRVGGAVKKAEILRQVAPIYPAQALAEGVTGVVKLDAIIDRQGLIREVRVLGGPAVLAASAVQAVEQWRYRPTVLNGAPVEVIITIEINFKISDPPKDPGKKID